MSISSSAIMFPQSIILSLIIEKKNWLEKEVRNQLNEGKKVDETRKEVIQVKEQRKEEDQRCRKLEKSEERENEACIFYFWRILVVIKCNKIKKCTSSINGKD